MKRIMIQDNSEIYNLGVSNLDSIIGGIPRGYVILLAGNPGSGKTTFAAQFLYSGLLRNESGLYISFVEPKQEFYRHMSKLGFEFEKFEKENLFTYIHVPTPSTKLSSNVLIEQILRIVEEKGIKRLAIDSISAITDVLGIVESRSLLSNLISMVIKPSKITSVLIAELPFGRQVIGYGFEEFLVDAIFILKVVKRRGKFRRFIEIRKFKDFELPRTKFEFQIRKGGLVLYVPYIEELKGTYLPERVSTGIEKLDEALEGGLLKGSITLIVGPSGTGKTILASKFVIDGILKNEKCLFITFDEPYEQIINLFKFLGIDYHDYEHCLRILSFSPRLYTPIQIYQHIYDILQSEDFNRAVIDGLSSLKLFTSGNEFIEFISSVISLFKAKRTTTIMTLTSDLTKDIDIKITPLVDNIFAIRFNRNRTEIERILTILKTRGTAHKISSMKLMITEDKIDVKFLT